MSIILEYIWIDAFENLRSKIKIIPNTKNVLIEEWSFDGSSCGQATGTDSDVLLKPVKFFKNPFFPEHTSFLVLCECYDKYNIPHVTNTRKACEQTYNKIIDEDPLFGIEQEYVLFDRDHKPLDWKEYNNPGCGGQGPYYCAVGGDRCFGRKISEKHLLYCLNAGIQICGTNAEVMASQWEFQIGPLNPVEVSDQLWVARYILMKITEEFGCYVSFHPKPHKGDWNGSGGHTNFSTKKMRESDGLEVIKNACQKLEKTHEEHLKVYGKYNEERLTGLHETSSMHTFSVGFSDRGKSIRIPLHVIRNKCGYFEDRRPASNMDPYLVTEKLLNTILN